MRTRSSIWAAPERRYATATAAGQSISARWQSTGAGTVLLGRQSGSGGYLNTTAVTFSGIGSGAAATAKATDGVITSVTVTNGGSGYTSAPTVNFTSSTGTGATGTAIVSNGVVTGVTVSNGGTGTLTASNYVIGALNTDATFAGAIVNSPGTSGGGDFLGLNIYKVGVGNWTLSGTSNFTGDVLVEAGTLTLSGALANDGDFEVGAGAAMALAGGILTTPTLTLDGSATLTGNGTINGNLVNQGTVSISSGTLQGERLGRERWRHACDQRRGVRIHHRVREQRLARRDHRLREPAGGFPEQRDRAQFLVRPGTATVESRYDHHHWCPNLCWTQFHVAEVGFVDRSKLANSADPGGYGRGAIVQRFQQRGAGVLSVPRFALSVKKV